MRTEQEMEGAEEGTGVDVRELVLSLAPEDVNLPELTNVRPFTSKAESEQDIRELQALMKSIEEEGQIQPIVVAERVEEEGPRYDVVAGRRRLRAIIMHNLGADEGKQLKVKAVLGDRAKSVAHLFRRAAHENVLRVGINPIDFAYNCREVRANMKWKGAAGTVKVAEFLGCSPAQVTQHEKLLGLEEGLQQALAEGKLTREGAYALLKVEAGKRAEVYKAAQVAQEKELAGAGGLAGSGQVGAVGVGEGAVIEAGWALAEGKVAGVDSRLAEEVEEGEVQEVWVDDDGNEQPMPTSQADRIENQPAKKKGKKSGAAKKGGVKAEHIKKAARTVEPDTKQSRSRKEILEFFAELMGPAFGYADGAVHKFCEKLALWAGGEVQDRALLNAFTVMVEKAERGNAPKVVEKKVEKVTGVPGKTVTKTGTVRGKGLPKKK